MSNRLWASLTAAGVLSAIVLFAPTSVVAQAPTGAATKTAASTKV